jgi:uncharacterized protein
MVARFELKCTSSGKYRFNLKAGNGEVILTSQLYQEKSTAEHGIESVKLNAITKNHFERKIARDGSRYFVLMAANGEVIGKSEMYRSNAALENGIRSINTNAPDARVEYINEVPALGS